MKYKKKVNGRWVVLELEKIQDYATYTHYQVYKYIERRTSTNLYD